MAIEEKQVAIQRWELVDMTEFDYNNWIIHQKTCKKILMNLSCILEVKKETTYDGGGRHLPKCWFGVNFINILRARFLYESKFFSFSLLTYGFVIFGAKILYKKMHA